MTLLTTVQNAMALCSLSVPDTVYANNTDIVKQMVRLLYVEGRDLLKRHDWSELLNVVSFACTASNAQTGYPNTAFDRFTRGAQSRTESGAGLGLAIVRQVAESHGGTIAVTAAPGGGARFVLTLPDASGPDA